MFIIIELDGMFIVENRPGFLEGNTMLLAIFLGFV